MAAPHSSSTWNEVDAVINALHFGTVADLKTIIICMNERCGTGLNRTARKQELVDRIAGQLTKWKNNDDVKNWKEIKPAVAALRLPIASYGSSKPLSSIPVYAQRYERTGGANHTRTPLPQRDSISAPGTSYPGFRGPTYSQPTFRFKQSPFFTVNQAVSPFLECPESFGVNDRREGALTFQLTDDQLEKLNNPASGYQIRLFCTSSKFYSPHRPANVDLLIEFPPTCEVFVNNEQIKGSLLKGMKKQPGTAPPPDIRPVRAHNAVRMVYISHTPQGQMHEYKKFYIVAQLVQAHSVSTLVSQLRQTRFVSGDEIRHKMRAAMSDDDDIIAGTLKLSLKCPLSFARISLPCRSAKCTHSQCFDATSWYAVMEQTTTWLCPICENVLDWRELVIDGLFADILNATPDTVDDVLLEADGTWRTVDGRYTSATPPGAFVQPDRFDLDSDDDE
ncbi:PINIT domain-containing protein [Mycena pura]|uniref:PINIT domain-containing protein n=1 Tax=Mycena pura TaxID=153505 RepID=A0AAD6Y3P9_9AGAR|nr:PINIT domain-containing protein [Mycena pura]